MEKGWLELTRRIGEALIIGDDIKIVVRGIKGNQVKFCIEAPKDISVHREEIYKKIQVERVEKIFSDLEVENESIDEELMSQLMRKFGQSANDETIEDTKFNK